MRNVEFRIWNACTNSKFQILSFLISHALSEVSRKAEPVVVVAEGRIELAAQRDAAHRVRMTPGATARDAAHAVVGPRGIPLW